MAFFVLPAMLSACHPHAHDESGLAFIGLPTALTVTPSQLAFTDIGAAYAQTVTVGAASFTTASTCAGIAAIAQANATSFTVTPLAAGSCVITISASGASATLAVTVAQTTVGGE